MKLSKAHYLLIGAGLGALGYGANRLTETKPLPPPSAVQQQSETPVQEVHTFDGVTFCGIPDSRLVIARRADGLEVWRSQGETAFRVPGGFLPVWLLSEGELWAVNPGEKRFERLDVKSGKFMAAFEPAEGFEFEGCCNPVAFAALGKGRFVTMEKGTRQIRLFSPDGTARKILVNELGARSETYRIRRDSADSQTLLFYDNGKCIGKFKDE